MKHQAVDPDKCSLHFVHDFSRKIFFRLCSINLLYFNVWLPLFQVICWNIVIILVCFPVCDVTNFETDFSFLIKLFFYMTKKPGQNWNKKSFWLNFKGISIARKRLRPKSAFLTRSLTRFRKCSQKVLPIVLTEKVKSYILILSHMFVVGVFFSCPIFL